MAMFVYVPKVITNIRDTVYVHKNVVKYKVLRTGREYMHLSAFAHSTSEDLKVPIAMCFTELEDAKKLCNKMAEAKVEQLQLTIKELQSVNINVLDDFKRHEEFMKALENPKHPSSTQEKGNG